MFFKEKVESCDGCTAPSVIAARVRRRDSLIVEKMLVEPTAACSSRLAGFNVQQQWHLLIHFGAVNP
jgi:hypothetical protein